MKGFIRQDLYHLALNMKFYLAFLLFMGCLAVFSDFNVSFLFLYVLIFCSSALLALFSYDEASHWQAYAATAPNGRKAQVDGRYLVGLLLCLAVSALMLILTLVSKRPGYLATPLVFGGAGMLLLYIDLTFPLSYRFGTRSRLIMIIVLAAIAGGAAAGSSLLVISGVPDYGTDAFNVGAILLSAIGLVGMVISHRVSVSIMAKKEF